jgi:hypothetical protein
MAFVLAAALVVSISGCGGGGSPSAPSSPTPQRTLVTQGTADIQPLSQGVSSFLIIQLGFPAMLEATVDWTNPSTLVALAWGLGNCAQDNNCAILAQNTGTAKPKTVTTGNLPAGTYTLGILNLGTANESVSYQIFTIR